MSSIVKTMKVKLKKAENQLVIINAEDFDEKLHAKIETKPDKIEKSDIMARLDDQLILPRCPHCGVDTPSLHLSMHCTTKDFKQSNERIWKAYACNRCGGVTMGWHNKGSNEAKKLYPPSVEVEEAIPERAREYLSQAIDSLAAPAGAVILAASAVDAMFKAKNYRDGTLYSRIDQAAEDHVITTEMAAWAHEVRLDANEQRHSDESAPLRDTGNAKRVIEFTRALGTFMFVLPSRVQRGIEEAKSD